MTMEILKVQDLCKTYGKGEAKVEALKKVSFSLDFITELYWSFGYPYLRPHLG